jgi:hypothetical protein
LLLVVIALDSYNNFCLSLASLGRFASPSPHSSTLLLHLYIGKDIHDLGDEAIKPVFLPSSIANPARRNVADRSTQ